MTRQSIDDETPTELDDDFHGDEIGAWSEIKLEIIREYATVYSRILAAQTSPRFQHVYVDGFAGSGVHRSKATGRRLEGSPLIALSIRPPFHHYYFIDLRPEKIESLSALSEGRSDVSVLEGDCNSVLLEEVFPQIRYDQYRRGLCLLDPYGLQLKWEVIAEAARMRSIDIILNFPVGAMHRAALRSRLEKVDPERAALMDSCWGDRSWLGAAYPDEPTLFGPVAAKTTNEQFAEAFRRRLKDVAGFKHVPKPIPMRNSRNVVLYYVYFASRKPVAAGIMAGIFDKYRRRRTS
jgi:three-Cys-motif partner protein